jgi:hypothetical protein
VKERRGLQPAAVEAVVVVVVVAVAVAVVVEP